MKTPEKKEKAEKKNKKFTGGVVKDELLYYVDKNGNVETIPAQGFPCFLSVGYDISANAVEEFLGIGNNINASE